MAKFLSVFVTLELLVCVSDCLAALLSHTGLKRNKMLLMRDPGPS